MMKLLSDTQAAALVAAAQVAAAKPRGAWATTTVYKQNDVVTFSGASYRALADHTAGASFAGDSAQWESWGSAGAVASIEGVTGIINGVFPRMDRSTSTGQEFVGSQRVKGFMTLRLNTSPTLAPELHYEALNGTWISGIDVANHGGASDFVPVARQWTDGSVEDSYYVSNNSNVPTNAPSSSSATTGGTLSAATRAYVVSATNGTGETVASPEIVATTTGSTGKVTLTWVPIISATGYKVYRGSSGGPYTLMATVSGQAPTPTAQGWATWADDGSLTPDGATNPPVATSGTWASQTPTHGIGITPPNRKYRLQVGAKDTEPWQGGLSIRVGLPQTGNSFAIVDNGGTERFWIEPGATGGSPLLNGNHASYGAGVAIQRITLAPTAAASSALVVKAPSAQATDIVLYQLNGVSKTGVSQGGLFRWVDSALEATTVGAAGAAAALPATPTKYLLVKDSAGTTLKIPAYS